MQQKECRASLRVPDELFGHVLERLDKEQRLEELRHKLTVVSSLLCGALVFLLSAGVKFWADAIGSGSTDFAWLVVTDFQVVTANLSIYVYSLLESIPVASFAVFSLLLLLVLGLFSMFAKYKILASRLIS